MFSKVYLLLLVALVGVCWADDEAPKANTACVYGYYPGYYYPYYYWGKREAHPDHPGHTGKSEEEKKDGKDSKEGGRRRRSIRSHFKQRMHQFGMRPFHQQREWH
ncbi:hypothetical protein M3Y97_00727600 [Aphelenchoides bicaudatus]|nr:hypothetical protein M3Y97_00727600 [Aphelenchoides bicaudatus]